MSATDFAANPEVRATADVRFAPQAWRLLNSASLEAVRGHEASCRAQAADAGILALRAGSPELDIAVDHVLGLLELSTGNLRAALWHLMRCARQAASIHLAHPALIRFEPDLVEALVALGRTADAERVTASLAHRAARIRTPWLLAAAARCCAMLAPDALVGSEFARALELCERTGCMFDTARTALAFGERLRRARRQADARAHLSRAFETFGRIGAGPWAERAARELNATNLTARLRGDPSNLNDLTPQERQVVRIVAAGATVRDAAARMFLSPKTVEAHLGRAYRKLGVHNRAQLASVVARQGALA